MYPGQAFDTEELYSSLSIRDLDEYATKTGLLKKGTSLDTQFLLPKANSPVLEVGCGCGRIGKEFIKQEFDYWGIELHRPYIDAFRQAAAGLEHRIIEGNFLVHEFVDASFNTVMFPWSVIGDFSSNDGQLKALERSRKLLCKGGNVLIDVPMDVVNKVSGYQPGYFDVHKKYDLEGLGLRFQSSMQYVTYTGRTRELIELRAQS